MIPRAMDDSAARESPSKRARTDTQKSLTTDPHMSSPPYSPSSERPPNDSRKSIKPNQPRPSGSLSKNTKRKSKSTPYIHGNGIDSGIGPRIINISQPAYLLVIQLHPPAEPHQAHVKNAIEKLQRSNTSYSAIARLLDELLSLLPGVGKAVQAVTGWGKWVEEEYNLFTGAWEPLWPTRLLPYNLVRSVPIRHWGNIDHLFEQFAICTDERVRATFNVVCTLPLTTKGRGVYLPPTVRCWSWRVQEDLDQLDRNGDLIPEGMAECLRARPTVSDVQHFWRKDEFKMIIAENGEGWPAKARFPKIILQPKGGINQPGYLDGLAKTIRPGSAIARPVKYTEDSLFGTGFSCANFGSGNYDMKKMFEQVKKPTVAYFLRPSKTTVPLVELLTDIIDNPDRPPKRDPRAMLELELGSMGLQRFAIPPEFVLNNCWYTRLYDDRYSDWLRYLQIAEAGFISDWHIDFGGTSQYFYVDTGVKNFYLLKPTPENIRHLERYKADYACEPAFPPVDQVKLLQLSAGESAIIPGGWIHAVYTPVSAVCVSGNFWTNQHLGMYVTFWETSVEHVFTERDLWTVVLAMEDMIKKLLDPASRSPKVPLPTTVDMRRMGEYWNERVAEILSMAERHKDEALHRKWAPGEKKRARMAGERLLQALDEAVERGDELA